MHCTILLMKTSIKTRLLSAKMPNKSNVGFFSIYIYRISIIYSDICFRASIFETAERQI